MLSLPNDTTPPKKGRASWNTWRNVGIGLLVIIAVFGVLIVVSIVYVNSDYYKQMKAQEEQEKRDERKRAQEIEKVIEPIGGIKQLMEDLMTQEERK